MTLTPETVAELRALLEALCEESIAPEQSRRLEELVLAHPEAEAFYVQYMNMHADLARHFSSEPNATESLRGLLAEETAAAAKPHPAGRLLSSVWRLGAISGLAAAVLLTVSLLWKSPPLVSPSESAGDPTDDSLAILIQASAAEWEDTGMPTRTGAPLPAGQLLLKSGCAQIEFYSGATVILEGPADFRLISVKEAYCARGKLRVTVPPQAQGFTVRTRKIDLVDLGTEFGMRVDGDDAVHKTEVHVFKGKVELYDAGSNRAPASRKEVTTGQGVRLDGPGGLSEIKADAGAFLTARDLALRSEADTRRRQREWLEASKALADDPSLLLAYTFETDKPWERIVTNQARGLPGSRDGAIVGCQWATGRWPGKQGLEFKRVSDRVRIHVPGEYESLTLLTWVRVDALPNRFNSLMLADEWEEGAVHWHISNNGIVALGIRGGKQQGQYDYHAGTIFTPDRLGQWLQLAVVFDKGSRQVTHFVDGQAVKRIPLRFDVPLRIHDAEIGNWNVGQRDARHIRNLNGCMDEFLLFSRALGEQEIQQLYVQGRPRS